MADNSHALRKIKHRMRQRMIPAFTLSDAINKAEMESDHRVLGFDPSEPLESGDFPHYTTDSEGFTVRE